MSSLAMTVVAGPRHPNDGDPSIAHLFGGLYIGGSGAWRFSPIETPGQPSHGVIPVSLRSERLLMDEIRAACALALDLNDAQGLADKKLGSDWRNEDLELEKSVLQEFAGLSRDQGLSLIITTSDPGLLADVLPSADDAGWSVSVCSPRAQHLETQWDSAK